VLAESCCDPDTYSGTGAMTTDSNEGLFVLDEDGEVCPTEYARQLLDESVI